MSRLLVFLRVAPFAVVALLALAVPLPTRHAPQAHTITLDSAQYEYMPSRIHVNQGDRVILTLTASDVVHGFYLDGYGIEQRVEPGVSQQIEFVADRRGKFRYRCSVSCGPLHPFMIGELVVGPNVLFWRAIALAVVVSAGLFANLYMKPGGPNESFQTA